MIIVFYHAQCQDGFASAFVARQYFGDSAEYIPVEYTTSFQKEYPLRNCEIVFVDFCPNMEDFVYLTGQGNRILVLDHHESRFTEFQGQPGCVFDKDKCGAVMTHEYFFPDTPVPLYLKYIQEEDLYRFKGETGRLFTAGLYTLPYSFEEWAAALSQEDFIPRMVERGRVVSEVYRQQAEFLAKRAVPAELNGEQIWCVNYEGPVAVINAIGSVISERTDTPVLIWRSQTLKKVSLSFRSKRVRTCIELASVFGGGGHPTASGASCSWEQFEKHVKFLT